MSKINIYPIETERLIIRPTNIDDSEFILELLNTPKWLENIGDRNVKCIEDAKNYIETKMLTQFEKLGFANNTIIRKQGRIKIGSSGLYDREGIDGVDIGFAFLPEYEKQGYAYESSKKLLEVGFANWGIKKVSAITTQENKASQRLIIKLGLKFQKIINIPNDDEDLMLYELLKD